MRLSCICDIFGHMIIRSLLIFVSLFATSVLHANLNTLSDFAGKTITTKQAHYACKDGSDTASLLAIETINSIRAEVQGGLAPIGLQYAQQKQDSGVCLIFTGTFKVKKPLLSVLIFEMTLNIGDKQISINDKLKQFIQNHLLVAELDGYGEYTIAVFPELSDEIYTIEKQ